MHALIKVCRSYSAMFSKSDKNETCQLKYLTTGQHSAQQEIGSDTCTDTEYCAYSCDHHHKGFIVRHYNQEAAKQ